MALCEGSSGMGSGPCACSECFLVSVVLALLLDGETTTLDCLGTRVFVAICAKTSLSKSPTMLSCETMHSTDNAISPTSLGTAVSLFRTAASKSPSTLVNSLTS